MSDNYTPESISAQLKQIQKSFPDTADVLMRIIDCIPVGIWVLDVEGTIIFGNKMAIQIWSGAKYVAPEHYDEYQAWHIDSGEKVKNEEWAASHTLKTGEPVLQQKFKILCFDNVTERFIINSALPLKDDAGALIGAIIVNEDITELSEQKLNLEKINKILQGREIKMVELKDEIAKLKKENEELV